MRGRGRWMEGWKRREEDEEKKESARGDEGCKIQTLYTSGQPDNPISAVLEPWITGGSMWLIIVASIELLNTPLHPPTRGSGSPV